jgi:hypothetical protein
MPMKGNTFALQEIGYFYHQGIPRAGFQSWTRELVCKRSARHKEEEGNDNTINEIDQLPHSIWRSVPLRNTPMEVHSLRVSRDMLLRMQAYPEILDTRIEFILRSQKRYQESSMYPKPRPPVRESKKEEGGKKKSGRNKQNTSRRSHYLLIRLDRVRD